MPERTRRAPRALLILLLSLGLSGAVAPVLADPPTEGASPVKEAIAEAIEAATEAIEAANEAAEEADSEAGEDGEDEDGDKTPAPRKTMASDPAYPAKALPDFSAVNDPRIVRIPIHGDIDMGLSPFVARGIKEAEGATLIILDVDTFGGRIDAAVQIRDAILATKTPTLAFVNRRAISAGALISLAADNLVFTPGGSMGAATPIQIQGGEATPVDEKMTSYMRSEMRASAEASGRNPSLAEAMVDASVAVEGVIGDDKLLTVTTEEALQTGLADGKAETLGDLLELLGIPDAKPEEIESNWAEQLARFLTNPVVSGLLMSLGMLGLFVELKSPGLGLPGAVGVLCMAAFFGGHLVANLAGWEDVLMFAAGFGLLIVEIFVLPGFGIAGVLGLLLLSMALVGAMFDQPLNVAWSAGTITHLLAQVMISFAVAAVCLALIARYLPGSRFSGGLVLKTTLGDAAVETAAVMGDKSYKSAPVALHALVGKVGVAETDLRMAGKARLDGRLIDVVSESEYIDRGTSVQVLAVEGVRVVVVRAKVETDSDAPGLPG